MEPAAPPSRPFVLIHRPSHISSAFHQQNRPSILKACLLSVLLAAAASAIFIGINSDRTKLASQSLVSRNAVIERIFPGIGNQRWQRWSAKAGRGMEVSSSGRVKRVIRKKSAEPEAPTLSLKERLALKAQKLREAQQAEDEEYAAQDESKLNIKPRAPVVTIMGHVDHGKTTLLDFLRKSKVASGEAGGITQAVGAYQVKTDHGLITFLDTPGHEAFSSMRERGARATDIVVLVVAADDGPKEQTIESIRQAQEAKVPIVVAISKVDKPESNVESVKQQLMNYDIMPEEWGGDNLISEISAKSGAGVDGLLDNILLQAEILECTAPTDGQVRGVVVESRMDKYRGPITTLLVQSGTLKKGSVILAGAEYGKVRNLLDDEQKQIKAAGPGTPVEVLGLSGCTRSGDLVLGFKNEKEAKQISAKRQKDNTEVNLRQNELDPKALFAQFNKKSHDVQYIVRADTHGSLEALTLLLDQMNNEWINIKILNTGVGPISTSECEMAAITNAIVVGFNVDPQPAAEKVIREKNVVAVHGPVIYDVLDRLKVETVRKVDLPKVEEQRGRAAVKATFLGKKRMLVAGCEVVEGEMQVDTVLRVVRKGEVIFEGEINSLRVVKDEVEKVEEGNECGILVEGFKDVKEGDEILSVAMVDPIVY
mmetsp:Transcript_16469/g.27221  ORF Transcript_16469/g.27221 Transcript_16469/m.27221 type:complete len:653 (+) Transcript_16469:42-2000(+)